MSDAPASTPYFNEQVLRKRPYLTLAMCEKVIRAPIRVEAQDDGRIRHWGLIDLQNDYGKRYLRVVTLADGVTVHNAFFDRDFVQET